MRSEAAWAAASHFYARTQRGAGAGDDMDGICGWLARIAFVQSCAKNFYSLYTVL